MAELRRFMAFFGREEEVDAQAFEPSALATVTPEDVCRYLNVAAFGVEHPNEQDKPIKARSNTLKAKKKLLSPFMPRRTLPWDDIRREGNPTRSDVVNSVIKDMMKLQNNNFSYSTAHPFVLVCQMRWSKNISEEREAPRQIVLGSMDDRLCPLLNLAVYVEISARQCESTDSFTFGNGCDGDRSVRALLQRTIDNEGYTRLHQGNLGTHSIRKGPATYCARSGVSKDSIEWRGRWQSAKRQVDTYIGIDRPLPDAHVASYLCGPSGPIKYEVVKRARHGAPINF
ncbi:TPA: hypothetical protein N0F65_000857 [Lagenidium giganteum]|uniref:Uncharacterized protein n=1 Tax=Lagenidium giganteum TaxID=4803 RepID=A0AAV2YID0_9STRA|nr:TPA: hypothetical protein N0F65_000857 [Lagenidium giganteum]